MNKKDLFNAIDKIDEKFITDAGKYLKDISPFRNEEPEELEPQKRRFSPIRLILPIAASLTVIVGITIALKTLDLGFDTAISTDEETSVADNNIGDDIPTDSNGALLDSAAATPPSVLPTDSDGTSLPVTETEIETVTETGDLPFTLYGPDSVSLTYDDITSIEHIANADDTSPFVLDAGNWQTISCSGFAYVAEPLGNNYNNVANPYTFDTNAGGVNISFNGSDSRRIYVGERFGDLVVNTALCEFRNMWMSSDNASYNDRSVPQLFNTSFVSFDGGIDTSGYIVKSEGNSPIYWFFFGCDENALPLMNYSSSQSGNFNRTTVKESFNGFSYVGELPSVRISSEYEAELNAYFVDTNVRAASVKLSNISMLYSADTSENYQLWADTEITSFGETPYGGTTYDPTIQAFIDSASTTEELSYTLFEKAKEMMKYNNLSSFTIFRDIQSSGGRHSLERVDEDIPLESGIFFYFYDDNGNVISKYEYAGTANQEKPDRPVE